MVDNSAPPQEKWGLSPSIRSSLANNQRELGKKITSMSRVVLVFAMGLIIILGANFALTLTAIVQNKDVYVGAGNHLVDKDGGTLAVSVAEKTMSLFEFPYSDINAITSTRVLIVPTDEEKLIVFPSTFEFAKQDGNKYSFSMKTADGSSLTWEPATPLKADGVLQSPFGAVSIALKRPDGRVTQVREPQGYEGRKLGPKHHGAVIHRSANHHAFDGHCNHLWHGWPQRGGHLALLKGYVPDHGATDSVPLSVYLAGTTMDFATHSTLGDNMALQMVARGFAAIRIEYNNPTYPGNCDIWETKARRIAGCVSQLCYHHSDNIDCSLGLAMFGWSQGGTLSQIVGNYNHDYTVSAALSFGGIFDNHPTSTKNAMVACLVPKLGTPPKERRRILIGEHDTPAGGQGEHLHEPPEWSAGQASVVIENAKTLMQYDDFDDLSCPGDTMVCLTDDGAGYVVVSWEHDLNQVETFTPQNCDACHWWFGKGQSGYRTIHFDGFSDAFSSTTNKAEWGAQANFDWLALTASDGTAYGDGDGDLAGGH